MTKAEFLASAPYTPRQYWLAPSGRLHVSKHCSGGPGLKLAPGRRWRRLTLTRAEARARPQAERCRCVGHGTYQAPKWA